MRFPRWPAATWTRCLPALAALLAACLPPLAMAQSVAASPEQARHWLQRMQTAASGGNYRGTLVFGSGGSMSSARVWHYCVGDQTYALLESQDGRQRQVVRHNEEVHTLWPQSRVAVVERREALPGWQVTPQSVDARALGQYQVRLEGVARVAGRDADVLLLQPGDLLRYPQRLWADRTSGLMLRAEVLAIGPERVVLESAAFSEVEIGVRPQPKAVTSAAARMEGYRVVRPKQQRTRLEDEGWTLPQPVAGFALTACIKRELDGDQAEVATAVSGATAATGANSANAATGTPGPGAPPADPVLQAVFSDGLAHVSVFIEPFDARRHKQPVQAHLGATGTVTLRRQNHWFTAVGDAPLSTLRLLAESLARKP